MRYRKVSAQGRRLRTSVSKTTFARPHDPGSTLWWIRTLWLELARQKLPRPTTQQPGTLVAQVLSRPESDARHRPASACACGATLPSPALHWMPRSAVVLMLYNMLLSATVTGATADQSLWLLLHHIMLCCFGRCCIMYAAISCCWVNFAAIITAPKPTNPGVLV